MNPPLLRWLRVSAPPWEAVAFVLLACGGCEVLAAWATSWGDFAWGFFRVREIFCVAAASVLGIYRVAAYHPQFDSEYINWLWLSPWQPHKPLPKGPLHVGLQDALFVGLLALLSAHERTLPVENVPLAFCLAYGLTMALSLAAIDQAWLALASLAAIGGVVRLIIVSPTAGLAGALLLAGPWSYYCVHVTLKTFPWTTRATEFRQSMRRNWQVFTTGHKEYLNQSIDLNYSEREVQWPFNRLHARVRPLVSRPLRVGIALVIGWWIYVVTSVPHGDQGALVMLGMAYPITVLLSAGGRLVLYSNVHWSPISLLGRIFTFRWIIPAYDVVFLTPLATVATAIAAPLSLSGLGLPPNLILSLSVPVVLIVVTLGGPRLATWQLTAPTRLFPGMRQPQLVDEI